MPITSSAKKALRQSFKRKTRNFKRKEDIKTILKEIKRLRNDKENDKALALLSKAYKAIDKAAKAGVIKKNTANRKKSGIAGFIAK